MHFEWDPAKEAANQRKHGVTFREALTVFDHTAARVFDDPEHSREEQREIIVGHSNRGSLLVVCFTERYEKIRIITARKATKRERKDYEQSQSKP
jgi:hypothetical protein